MRIPTIAVIGAGFSGSLLSVHLLRRCPASVRVILIERNAQFGRGQAYSTGNPTHLLNVPAGRMSAFHDQPMHFVHWLRSQDATELGVPRASESSFVSRRLYGQYIRSLLKEELRRESHKKLELVRGSVHRVDRTGPTLRLSLDRDRWIEADLAVLATGHFPPAPVPVQEQSFYDSGLYRPDPWSPDALEGLDQSSPILLIGTGLTTVDVVISLLDQGHTGPIHALSRRGLLPLRHSARSSPSADTRYEFPTELLELTRFLRKEAAQAARSEDGSWQQVVDDVRPLVQDIWQAMPAADKSRFLRHLRPWWDIHRHRMAPSVAARIDRARHSNQLRIHAGRVLDYEIRNDGADVTFRHRGTDQTTTLSVARVINCSGPGADYERVADPLIRSLLDEGTARADPLRLGLDVTTKAALRSRSGSISRRLFAVGPVTKGAFWEMTAVPDIRRQCELLAQHLAELVVPFSFRPRPDPEPMITPRLAISPRMGEVFA
ncbi:MAG: FAD/NAD(P)-binding protein [Acetobacteraceae bacterium]|nr:FAD/NAD(P)-binding protein [Acetobacteraceae bacterium]